MLSSSASEIKAAALEGRPFEEAEVEQAVKSLRDLAGNQTSSINWDLYKKFVESYAHHSHKQWDRTAAAAEEFAKIFTGPARPEFQTIFKRILRDGKWEQAVKAAKRRPDSHRPWVVLITGLNGIRKTSSTLQPWFRNALSLALNNTNDSSAFDPDDLPDGQNSFFRQLDYMVATIANESFRHLYTLTDVSTYAVMKDAIFARHRSLAEILGALLVGAAQEKALNVMVETSGRDIAMFKYIDHFFPDSEYRKLVVHFTINDIQFAEQSVDKRMQREMRDGAAALEREAVSGIPDPASTVDANSGGPYGSVQLRAVQRDSDAVWQRIVGYLSSSAGDPVGTRSSGGAGLGTGDTGTGRDGEAMGISDAWLRAELDIHARPESEGEWTCCVAGQEFEIGPLSNL